MSNSIIKDEWAPSERRCVDFYYNENGLLWKVLNVRWRVNEVGPYDFAVADGRDFYCDSPRGRCRSAPLNVRDCDPKYPQWCWPTPPYPPDREQQETWTDYVGDQPYGDFGVQFDPTWPRADPVVTERTRYLSGFGVHGQETLDSQQPPQVAQTRYYRADLIRSTVLLTAEVGNLAQPPPAATAYTAFGELLDSSGSPGGSPPSSFGRYQYAGGWGYESPAGEGFAGAPGGLILAGVNPTLPPITLLHVGARWYDPSLGRFIQRDPIGLLGGMSAYLYVEGNPLAAIDPEGLFSWIEFIIRQTLLGIRQWALNLTQTPARPLGPTLGTCMPIFRATQAAPDIARIHVGVTLRRRILLEGTGDLNQDLDNWDRIRQRIVF